MNTSTKRPLALLSLLACLTAAPGCEFFSDTIIPSVDNRVPYSWVAVYTIADGHVGTDHATNGHVPITASHRWQYVIEDPNELHMALAATTDSGGAKQIRMQSQVVVRCFNSPYWFALEPLDTRVKSQSGSVGDTVENGVWTGRPFKPSEWFDQIYECDHGYISMNWITKSEDFSGNVSHHGPARLIYGGSFD